MGEAAGGSSDFYRHPRSDLGWLVNQLLVLAAQRTGQSLNQFAETINRRLGRPAVSPHMLEEWGRGRGLPPPDVLVAALQVAGADLPHLIESLRSGVDPATLGDIAGSAESPDLVPYDEGDSGSSDVKRRHFLQYLAMSGGATAGAEQLQLTLEALERLGRALASTCRVDAATIQYMEERVAGYWQDYYATRLPALDLLPYARTDLDTVSNLLNRSLAPAVRLRLCAVAARAATVVGALVWDTGK